MVAYLRPKELPDKPILHRTEVGRARLWGRQSAAPGGVPFFCDLGILS